MYTIGRFRSVAVFLITAGSFRRSEGLKSSSINPRMKKAKICCRKRMWRSSYSEQCILKHQYFLSPKVHLFALFWSAFCLFYKRWRFATKVRKTPPSSCGTTILKYLFEAGPIIFPVKKCVLLTEDVIQWWSSLTVLSVFMWRHQFPK